MHSLHDFIIINIFHIWKINFTITVCTIFPLTYMYFDILSAKQMFIQVKLIFHSIMNNFTNMRERERERIGETQGEERVRWVKRGMRSACQCLGYQQTKSHPIKYQEREVGYSSLLSIHGTTHILGYWTDVGEYWHELAVKVHTLARNSWWRICEFYNKKLKLVKNRFREKQNLNNTKVLESALDLLIGSNPTSSATLDVVQYDDDQ